MTNVGIVVADAPGTCIQYYEEALKRVLVVSNLNGFLVRPVVCAINRAGLKLLEAGYNFPIWSSWHYNKLVAWQERTGYQGKLVTDNNTRDDRILKYDVRVKGGSSVLPAAQILHKYYKCPRVIIVNVEFSGDYKLFLQPWKENTRHLEWCRAYTGPLKGLLGVPTRDWLIQNDSRLGEFGPS